jgi:hypothetical protein
MRDDELIPVAVRVFAFSVLPILLAALHVRLDANAQDRDRKVEVYLIYLFMLGVGASGLSGFFGHVFIPDTVAASIDWPKGSPFQQELGFAGLAFGVLGFIAAGRRDGFREATVIAVAIFGGGATLVHVFDIIQDGNLAAGNSIQNVANLLRPAVLIPMLIVSRRLERGVAKTSSFDRWRMRVVGTAGVVTALVGTGFGVGSSVELAVPATLVAAALAIASIAARARLEATQPH